jgi:hypothetical protein
VVSVPAVGDQRGVPAGRRRLLDNFFAFWRPFGVADRLDDVQGVGIPWAMVPSVQSLLLYGLKTLFRIKRMYALPALLCSHKALMRLVGFNAQQVRQGVCQRGAATQLGPRTTGPISAATLADHIVTLNVRALAVLFNSVIRALAKTRIFGAKVIGLVEATDLETTALYEGCGQATCQRKITDKHGKLHAIEVTLYG